MYSTIYWIGKAYGKRKNNKTRSRWGRKNTSEACEQPPPASVNTLRPVVVKRGAVLRCLYFSISQARYCFNVMRKKRRSPPLFKHLRVVYAKECHSTPVSLAIATTSPCDELHRFVVPRCHFHYNDKSKRSHPTGMLSDTQSNGR